MASDQRWTGGIANREWSRGHAAAHVTDKDRLMADVRQYLADCRTHQAILSPKYHPTLASALKVIHHHPGDVATIQDAYGEACRADGEPGHKAIAEAVVTEAPSA